MSRRRMHAVLAVYAHPRCFVWCMFTLDHLLAFMVLTLTLGDSRSALDFALGLFCQRRHSGVRQTLCSISENWFITDWAFLSSTKALNGICNGHLWLFHRRNGCTYCGQEVTSSDWVRHEPYSMGYDWLTVLG